jgi:3-hydroxyisobutyrate dehydrogenase-like beta-hydroxyacid dehydrogenase
MGSALGASLTRSGQTALATLAGRSTRTRELAAGAPLDLRSDLADVVAASEIVLSVVPPGNALETARAIAQAAAQTGHRPLVVDLNAISPTSLLGVERALGEAGVDLVDGSISGPPPWQEGTTRIYLSGPRAREIAALGFDGVDVRVIGSELGKASALKMSTASMYKGISLLLIHALVTARAHGTVDEVVDDLRGHFPELLSRPELPLASAASKSRRFVAEMHEIAETQAAAGLPPGVFEAIANAYEAISASPAAQETPEGAASVARLDDLLAGIAPTVDR